MKKIKLTLVLFSILLLSACEDRIIKDGTIVWDADGQAYLLKANSPIVTNTYILYKLPPEFSTYPCK